MMDVQKWVDDTPITSLDTDWLDPAGDGLQVKSYRSILEFIRRRLAADRDSVLAGTTEYWNSQPTLGSVAGTLYIYTDKFSWTDDNGAAHAVPGIKVGDGTSYLIDMPFVGDDIRNLVEQHVGDNIRHITQDERELWNDKVNVGVDNATLVFNVETLQIQ